MRTQTAPAVLVQRNCRLSERRCGPSMGAIQFSCTHSGVGRGAGECGQQGLDEARAGYCDKMGEASRSSDLGIVRGLI
jgi:hypothetical protein